jgi:putative flippase GtrA
MIRNFMSSQFFFFLLTGGLAALVNFSSRIGYSWFVDYSTAIVLAYCTGMITAFTLAKLLVFPESRQSVHRSAFYFVLVNIVAAAQTWIISLGLAFYALPYIGIQHYVPEIAHAIGLVAPIFTSYMGHNLLSFRE